MPNASTQSIRDRLNRVGVEYGAVAGGSSKTTSRSLRPGDDLVMGVRSDAAALHSMRLTAAVVDDEHVVMIIMFNAGTAAMFIGLDSLFGRRMFGSVALRSDIRN